MKGEKKVELAFVTNNRGKFLEASKVLGKFGILISKAASNKIEIQSLKLEEIAVYAAVEAYSHIHKPLIVEDTGLFIKALNWFPGAFTSFVYQTIGMDGIITLLKAVKDRSAYFETVVAYYDGIELKTFSGKAEGFILDRPTGEKGFGFDPIFSPKQFYPKSFGQMGIKEKNSVSHRAQAFTRFSQWFVSRKERFYL